MKTAMVTGYRLSPRGLAGAFVALIGIGAVLWVLSGVRWNQRTKLITAVPPDPRTTFTGPGVVGGVERFDPEPLRRSFEVCVASAPDARAMAGETRSRLVHQATDLLSVHLGGSFEEYRAYMETQGRLSEPMFQWDEKRQREDWATRSASLRNARLDLSKVVVRKRFENGRIVPVQDRPVVSDVPPSGSGVFDEHGSGTGAGYEIVIPIEVTDIHGRKWPVRMGVFFGEQGGTWRYWKYSLYDVPLGVLIPMPPM
jgi:hypothetical protein